jgi:ABC-2 type transport system ATP-binding protein
VAVIETIELRKSYRRIEALKGVSLRVERGEIYGLLGQNGAGKSTLVKILLSIVRRTSGEARMLGEPVGTTRARQKVGYLPEDHQFPPYHSAVSLLHFYGRLYGMSRSERNQRIPKMLDLVGLATRGHSKIRTYSKGMKQRLGLAQAMFHDPDLIILDEPTDGVDPVGRREIRLIMQRLKDEGKTIFLNSHLLSEVELVCDRVGILQRGEMIREGDLTSLTRQKGLFVVGLADGEILPVDELKRQGYAVTESGHYWEIGLSDGRAIDSVVDWLRAKGLHLRHLVEKRQTLEDLFVATVDAAEPGVDRPRWAPH